MGFEVKDRVRLKAGAPGSSKEGTVALVNAPRHGHGQTHYAVHWDGERTIVPGYPEKELEKIT
jgi:hypothetical protein